MEHLVFLNLSNNRIEQIEGLKGAEKLKILDLSDNKIKKI
jgi:Leucine-rich repeat (LRR) protein